MNELHLERSDFHLEWYSGKGGGGQHRNKHQNCCRITHVESGIRAQCTRHKERQDNRREAFEVLAARLLEHYAIEPEKPRRSTAQLVRVYHAERNVVIDKASGREDTFQRVVIKGNLGEMIEARLHARREEKLHLGTLEKKLAT